MPDPWVVVAAVAVSVIAVSVLSMLVIELRDLRENWRSTLKWMALQERINREVADALPQPPAVQEHNPAQPEEAQ